MKKPTEFEKRQAYKEARRLLARMNELLDETWERCMRATQKNQSKKAA